MKCIETGFTGLDLVWSMKGFVSMLVCQLNTWLHLMISAATSGPKYSAE